MKLDFQFMFPTRVVSGIGVRRDVVKEATAIGVKKIFVVTGSGSTKTSPYLKEILDDFAAASMEVLWFSEVEQDPSFETITKGVALAQDFNPDLVFAFGGGSPMDAAKFINIILGSGGVITDYVRGTKVPTKNACPMFFLPTTAGTASEVSRAAVAKDGDAGEKLSISHYLLCPQIAFLDPEPQLTMPPAIAAATGMDALTHAIEGFLSINRNPISDAAALEAITRISQWLRPAVGHSGNVEARGEMLIASMLAGIGFLGPGTGAVHGVAHILGGQYGVPHGVANAVMLPYVMEYSRIAEPARFARIAKAMGEPIDQLTVLEASYAAVEAVEMLRGDLGIPATLEELGIPKADLPKIAHLASKQRNVQNNIRKVNETDILAILEMAYSSHPSH